ncbi:MAG TPA: hypothetical protein VGM78_05715, partial [Ilumatobacteraceae bacterium]
AVTMDTARRRPIRSSAVLVVAVLALLAACSSGSGGSKKLALGTEADVAYTSPASGSTAAVDTTVGVTVLAVRQGTQDELTAGGIQVDDDAKDATPYYVDVRYANKGTGAATRTMTVSMEDNKGDDVPTTLIFALDSDPFTKCPDVSTGAFNPGDTYPGCTLFLVPKGRSAGVVRFVSQAPDATITFTDWEAK